MDRHGADTAVIDARQEIRGRCSPGVVPVLVWLVFQVPGFPGNGRPSSAAIGCSESGRPRRLDQ